MLFRSMAPARLIGVAGSDFMLTGARPKAVDFGVDGGLTVDLAPGLSAHAGAQFTSDLVTGRTINAGVAYRW